MTKIAQNGSAERCCLPQNGISVERFPLALLTVAKLRHNWGPGTYQGQWMMLDGGAWRGRGRIRAVRILAETARESRPSTRLLTGPEASESAAPLAVVPHRDEFPPEVIDARVRAEREISRMRLDAERELNEQRLSLRDERMRLETDQRLEEMRREFALARRPSRDDGDDDDDREPGPWDWLAPFFEKLKPALEQVIPPLLTKLGKLASS